MKSTGESPVPIYFLFHINGDMSRRVMTNLEAMAPRVDIYSNDEAFLDLTGIDRVVSFEEFRWQVKDAVYGTSGFQFVLALRPPGRWPSSPITLPRNIQRLAVSLI